MYSTCFRKKNDAGYHAHNAIGDCGKGVRFYHSANRQRRHLRLAAGRSKRNNAADRFYPGIAIAYLQTVKNIDIYHVRCCKAVKTAFSINSMK
jgi:hypothetical protein